MKKIHCRLDEVTVNSSIRPSSYLRCKIYSPIVSFLTSLKSQHCFYLITLLYFVIRVSQNQFVHKMEKKVFHQKSCLHKCLIFILKIKKRRSNLFSSFRCREYTFQLFGCLQSIHIKRFTSHCSHSVDKRLKFKRFLVKSRF